jgi:hypothetical protein
MLGVESSHEGTEKEGKGKRRRRGRKEGRKEKKKQIERVSGRRE